jgi:hypothetical protein
MQSFKMDDFEGLFKARKGILLERLKRSLG